MTQATGAETHLFEISALPANLAPHTCDVVVLAGSVHFGKHDRRLERFALEQRVHLAKVESVLVSVSGAASTSQGRPLALDAVRGFLGNTGWSPDRIELFAGGEPYTKYGFFTRWFMVRYAKRTGRVVDPHRDYDFTDWAAVDRFARSLVLKEHVEDELAVEDLVVH